MRLLACALGLAALGVPTAADSGELRVGAAASLREVVAAGARSFEAAHPELRVRVSYGASSALAAQVRAGAPLDALLSADVDIARALAREGLAETPSVLARNRLVVVAAPDLALDGPEDLLGLERIAVPDYAVPVGRYAREWLAARDLLEPLRAKLIPTEHARATLAAVDQGAVDAAIVYATDARMARRARVAFEVPAAEQPEIVYAACVLRDAGAAEAARAFLAWWSTPEGRARLEEGGFTPAAP